MRLTNDNHDNSEVTDQHRCFQNAGVKCRTTNLSCDHFYKYLKPGLNSSVGLLVNKCLSGRIYVELLLCGTCKARYQVPIVSKCQLFNMAAILKRLKQLSPLTNSTD